MWRYRKFHGRGKLTLPEYSYDGDFQYGLFHGRGTLKINNLEYIGDFYENKAEGEGKLKIGAKDISGRWRNNILISKYWCFTLLNNKMIDGYIKYWNSDIKIRKKNIKRILWTNSFPSASLNYQFTQALPDICYWISTHSPSTSPFRLAYYFFFFLKKLGSISKS